MSDENVEYKAESADALVGEIFGGRVSIVEALRRLRTRLLDLSSRNRLLNYRHPKRRCVQIVDEPALDLLFERLLDGKSVLIKAVPEPDAFSYEAGKKPEARQYAQQLRIGADYEFPDPRTESNSHRRTPTLQALFYPADLDKFLRKISYEARTVIEETGTNMLYLMFGFLEFYDSDTSEKALLAPLISVPVALTRGAIDPDTRAYRYTLAHTGEDIAENHTLREKLQQDFRLNLPELGQEESPEGYFGKIRRAIRSKQRWRVRRQLTLGFLSFGKLAIWADLDQAKWPELTSHPLLRRVFEGRAGGSSADGFHAEDYQIDAHEKADLPLIYDADSSQHSAIIDVLDGKDLVINGPPGTGKSQTITNVIAAALSQGKKVLFVSEKLAALEVVRHRLERAHLGHFCLELHSHKTQKKKLLEEIGARLEQRYRPQSQLQEQLALLLERKKRLNRYAELMASHIGNGLGMTIHGVFWAAQRRRQELADVGDQVASVVIRDATAWDLEAVEQRRTQIESLGLLFQEIGSYGTSHPWWGFKPRLLSPGDDVTLAEIVTDLVAKAENIVGIESEFTRFVSEDSPCSVQTLQELAALIAEVPEAPKHLVGEILPRLFLEHDRLGNHSRRVLSRLQRDISSARELLTNAQKVLNADSDLEFNLVSASCANTQECLSASALDLSVSDLTGATNALGTALQTFTVALDSVSGPYVAIRSEDLTSWQARLEALSKHGVRKATLSDIQSTARSVLQEHGRLHGAYEGLAEITSRFKLPFDPTPESIAHLAQVDPILGILPGVQVDERLASEAQRHSQGAFSSLSIEAGYEKLAYLRQLLESYRSALEEIHGAAQLFGLNYEKSSAGVGQVDAILRIACDAPQELLEFRHDKFAHPRFGELASKAERAAVSERVARARLEQEFYLDALPSADDLKGHIRVFRRGDGFFNFLYAEWRSARRQYRDLSKNKRRLTAPECEQKLTEVVTWLELRAGFINNQDFREWLGSLFEGLETDFKRIRRLQAWYEAGQGEILKHPALAGKVDLTRLNETVLTQLAARGEVLQRAIQTLRDADTTLVHALGVEAADVLKAKEENWPAAIQALEKLTTGLAERLRFFTRILRRDVSLARGVELLQARLELNQASQGLSALLRGPVSIAEAGKTVLSGLRDLPCNDWIEYLDEVKTIADAAEDLVEFGRRFAPPTSTLISIEHLLKAKLDLDDAFATIGKIRVIKNSSSWDEYARTARAAISSAQGLTRLVLGQVKEDSSLNAVTRAIKHRDEARQIVGRLSADADVRAYSGASYDGINTNTDVLVDTHEWGTIVSKAFASRHAGLWRKLLLPEARENLACARRLLQDAAVKIASIRESFKVLDSFGNFDWDAWHLGSRAVAHEDLPVNVKARLELALEHSASVLTWSKYLATKNECMQSELRGLVAGLEGRKIPTALLVKAFEFVLYQSIGKQIYKKYPELNRFSGSSHEKTREEFVSLDKKIIELNGRQFGHLIDKNKRLPEGDTGVRAGDYTELALVRRELNKQRRHIPIRQLVKRAGRTLQELKPCFMMGPLSVAQYLEPGTVKFDLVVMDEASQLRVEEALGAIARGTQLVVVGDPKQLPPTTFFDRLADGEEDEESDETPTVVSGMESILDVCQQLFHPVRTLRWHYRSQHESLIAFSNHHFYRNLIVFPSPYSKGAGLGVRYRYVPNGIYKDRQNFPEAQRVVDAVVEHMLKRPKESLGVVTLNLTQRELIEDLLDKKLRSFEEGERFLSYHHEKGWPFFVKNLENVQGDERDVIFISTTFGRAPDTDRPRQNFGPISRPDGWRRLNVLFTRARIRVELFTSMRAEDIVVDSKTPLGTKALRDYLDYARNGVLATTELSGRDPDSDFEIAVAEAIRSRGYEVDHQLGVAGFFIDLVVRNPERPGEYLAAVECDGAAYHSSTSARDRDRIRQEILEALGWRGRIYRIWSTDWFYDPRRETNRLAEFLERRRAFSRTEPISQYAEPVAEEAIDSTAASLAESIDFSKVTVADTADLFVEVGNRVTYCFVDTPAEKQTVLIVDSESNPKMGILNEHTPVAQALLGLSQGEIAQLQLPGAAVKALRVLKIHRNGDDAG